MAYWQPVKYKNKNIVRQFGDGINTYGEPFDIKDSQLIIGYNMCCDDYPAIRTRNDREKISYLDFAGTLQVIGQRNNQYMHINVGANWYQADINTTGGFTAISTALTSPSSDTHGKFIEFNTEAKRYTILAKKSTDFVAQAYDGTTTLVSLTTNAPNSHLYTVFANRVFGVDSNFRTIKYSAIGTCTDWTTLPGINSGSFDLTNAKGPITAICTYADHVIIWTNNSMHELWNKEPINFYLQDVSNEIGCVGNYAYTECNGALYFIAKEGIYKYTGGVPVLISQPVQKYIDLFYNDDDYYYDVTYRMNTYKNKVYAIVRLKAEYVKLELNNADFVLVYDTVKNVWTIEDGWYSTYGLVNINNKLYSAQESDIYNFVSTSKTGYDASTYIINSYIVTKAYNDFNLDSAIGLKDIWLMYSGTTNSSLDVKYTTNIESEVDNLLIDTNLHSLFLGYFNDLIPSSDISFTSTTLGANTNNETIKESFNVPTSMVETQHYQLKFNMTGHVKINGMQLNCISYGGD